uniref:IP12465p n=1 Tax=Drosophila melanogaster TaxID=7227 RepID=Q4V6S5_DROME|nr:IP12465p [Drosophila melanogaster]
MSSCRRRFFSSKFSAISLEMAARRSCSAKSRSSSQSRRNCWRRFLSTNSARLRSCISCVIAASSMKSRVMGLTLESSWLRLTSSRSYCNFRNSCELKKSCSLPQADITKGSLTETQTISSTPCLDFSSSAELT